MASSVLYRSMSLDGYIAGPNDEPSNPGGEGFMRLHDWLAAGESGRPSGPPGELVGQLKATGAVLVGRRTAEQAGHYNGDHHGVPVFVLSHRPPPASVASYPLVRYVTEGIASAMAQAKAAAGELDDIQIHQIPVLLGGGRRLFEVLPERIELEIARVIGTPAGHPYPLPHPPLSLRQLLTGFPSCIEMPGRGHSQVTTVTGL